MRDEIMRKIEKWQEPPPAKIAKPLPRPDEHEGKKRRGGRRLRKMKERYGLTDMRKAANRMHFNVAEEEYMDGDEVSSDIQSCVVLLKSVVMMMPEVLGFGRCNGVLKCP